MNQSHRFRFSTTRLIIKLFSAVVQTWSLFHNENSRDLDSGNKPVLAAFFSLQTSVELFSDQSLLLNVFLSCAGESLTNVPNRDISVGPFTQWFTFFTFQLGDTDIMIHMHKQTHRGGHGYLLCENSHSIALIFKRSFTKEFALPVKSF